MISEAELPALESEDQPRTPRVSVVIVSLNRAPTLRESLHALGEQHQVIVVDNGSSDGSQQLDSEFPHVRFSKLPRNFGLTKALNIGVRAAENSYILLLHDDAVITAPAVERLADFLEGRSDAGAVCPLLLTSDGKPAPQVSSPLSPAATELRWETPAPADSELTVESPLGAAIMFRASFLRALRQIDERYGTFGSAAELSAQVKRASRKIVVLRDVTAVHYGLASPEKSSLLAGDRIAGTAAYLAKHHGFMAGMMYRVKSALLSLVTFRFRSLAGALSGAKIDGTS